MDKFYKGWDVHAYEKHFNDALDKNKHYHALKPITREHFNEIVEEIEKFYKPINEDAHKALEMTKSRYVAPDGAFDQSLKGRVNMHRLLVRTWRLVQKINDESIYDMFEFTLKEISTTCTQGLTYRLLGLFIALWGAPPPTSPCMDTESPS